MDYQIEFRDVSVSYGKDVALRDINIQIPKNEIFGIIGPANAGKTTFLKAINRTLEFVHNAKTKGEVLFDGKNVKQIRNVYGLRRKVGVVFPLPVGLPMSIYENICKLTSISKTAPWTSNLRMVANHKQKLCKRVLKLGLAGQAQTAQKL